MITFSIRYVFFFLQVSVRPKLALSNIITTDYKKVSGPPDHLHPPNALYDSENLSRKVAQNIIKKHLEIYCMFFVDLRLFNM